MDDITPPNKPKSKLNFSAFTPGDGPEDKPEVSDSVRATQNPVREYSPSPIDNSHKAFVGGGKKHRFSLKNLTKKQKILLIIIFVLLLVAGGSIYAYLSSDKKSAPAPAAKKEEPPKTTEPSNLTGVEVSIDLNKRPVTAVVIENSPDARPQAGLVNAGVVFEAIAEGGITRFLALYQEAQPDHIGPIRSARPYFLDWLLGFDASFAHVGGSPEALGLIGPLKVKDLDQFRNAGAYQRVSGRYAPHNMYSSMAKLDGLNQSKGFTSSEFTSLARKNDEPSAQPAAKSIDLSISSALYNVHYDYDAASNSYKRVLGGKPHVDEKSAAQISPKVVLALTIPRSLHPDGKHTKYTTIGSGKVYIFQDGNVTTGTWKKDDPNNQFVFTDANGAPLKLNKGQTWFSFVDNETKVASKP